MNAEEKKLIDFISTGTKENIELAFQLAKGQNIDLESIAITEYNDFCNMMLDKKQKTSIKTKLINAFQNALNQGDDWGFYGRKNLIISPKISEFKHIKSLSFHDCKFSTLPNEIGELENLEQLKFINVKITVLPSSIQQLKKLKSLIVNQNKTFYI